MQLKHEKKKKKRKNNNQQWKHNGSLQEKLSGYFAGKTMCDL